MRIKSVNKETKEVNYFNTMDEASKSIKSRMDNWKIQMFIAYAMINKAKAFKCTWEEVK